MKAMFFFVAVVCALVVPAAGRAQDIHSGDWWKGLSGASKLGFVEGFLDGMALGHNLSLMGAGTVPDPDCRTKIAQSYTYARNRFFSGVSMDRIAAELDALYADGDNSSIILGRAVWIVVNRLGGTSADDVEKLILQSRGMH